MTVAWDPRSITSCILKRCALEGTLGFLQWVGLHSHSEEVSYGGHAEHRPRVGSEEA